MPDEPNDPPRSAFLNQAANRFFPDGGPAKQEVELDPEQLKRIQALAESHGTTEAEAIQLAITTGLAFLAAERALQVAAAVGDHNPAEVERLLKRHIEIEGEYAVMKNRLWMALEDNKIMSFRDGALAGNVIGYQQVMQRQKGEIAALQAQVADLRSKIPADGAAPVTGSDSARPGGFWQRLLKRLRRRS